MRFISAIKTEYLIVFLIIIVASFMRFYHLDRSAGFAWDEETIAWKVKQILIDGKFTLIGMKSGEFGVFTGPALIYIFSLIYRLSSMNPFGIHIASAVLGVITALVFLVTGKNIFNKRIGMFAGLLYGGSYFLSNYDRSWLLFSFTICSLLIFYQAFLLFKKKEKKYLFIIFFMTGFTFNLHITAIFLLIIILLAFFIFKRKFSIRDYLTAAFLLALWLSPLVLFDLRHNFLNIKGITNLLSFHHSYNLIAKSKLLFTIASENIIRIIFPEFRKIFLLLVLIPFLMLKPLKDKNLKILVLLWIIVPAFLLIFYTKNIPEYYLMVSIPGYVFLLADFLDKVLRNNNFLFIFLVFFLFLNISTRIKEPPSPLGLIEKNKIVEFIIKDSQGKPFNVYYNMPFGLDNGFSYLFWHRKAPYQTVEVEKQYTIVVLDQLGVVPSRITGARLIKEGGI